MKPTANLQYFQSQSSYSSDCGWCAVNNFLGFKAFSRNNMDELCEQLSKQSISTFKSFFGGDFDISVLVLALGVYQFAVQWIKPDEDLQTILNCQQFRGFLINTKSTQRIWHTLLNRSGNHWTCIKPWDDKFVLYDSLKKKPEFFFREQVKEQLKSIMNNKGTVLMIKKQHNIEESTIFKSMVLAKQLTMQNQQPHQIG